MRKGILIAIALAGILGFMVMGAGVLGAQELRVISEETGTGFVHPESVAYDPQENVLICLSQSPLRSLSFDLNR